MSRVDLDELESGLCGPLRRLDVLLDDGLDLVDTDLAGRLEIAPEGNIGGSLEVRGPASALGADSLLGRAAHQTEHRQRRALATCVRQLDACATVLAAKESCEALQRRHLLVLPQTAAGGRDTALGRHGRCLHDHQRSAACRVKDNKRGE